MKITKTNTVIEYFPVDNIVLLVGGVLKDYQKKNNANVQHLNIPQQFPPDAPRIVVSSTNTIINISLTRFEIICKIPDHIVSNPDSIINFTKKNVIDIISQLWQPELKYNWIGLVSTVDFPLKNSNIPAVIQAIPFYDKLINIDRNNRDLGSFEVKFGYKEELYYRNFGISCYETRDVKIPTNEISHWQKIFNLEEVSKIKESGLRIIYDVNNKPKSIRNDIMSDLDELIVQYKSSLPTIIDDLNMKDLIV